MEGKITIFSVCLPLGLLCLCEDPGNIFRRDILISSWRKRCHSAIHTEPLADRQNIDGVRTTGLYSCSFDSPLHHSRSCPLKRWSCPRYVHTKLLSCDECATGTSPNLFLLRFRQWYHTASPFQLLMMGRPPTEANALCAPLSIYP